MRSRITRSTRDQSITSSLQRCEFRRNPTDAHYYLTFWWRTTAATVALPGSSVGLATGYRGNPRVFTARATAFYCTWPFHGKCHGCGHGTCRGSVRGNLRGTNHTATHESTTATATAYSMATSTSIAAAIHGNQRRMPRQSSTMGISQVEQVLRSEAGVFLILEEPHIPTADRLRGRI